MNGQPRQGSLTRRQLQVLEVIVKAVRQNGAPPTFREIRDELGLRSVRTVQDHVAALQRKGVLDRHSRKARGLALAGGPASTPVPVLGRVPAGTPLEAIESYDSWIAAPVSGQGLFALRVLGDSMRDAGILDGDLVVVERMERAHQDEIVVALVHGEVTVKRLDLSTRPSVLRAANPMYAPIPITDEDARILGRVIGLWRAL